MRTSMTSKPSQLHNDRPRATHARPRSILLGSVTLGLIAALLVPHTTLANSYAGWAASADKRGIRGNIGQASVAPIYGEAVISWVGLCAFSCTSQPYADSGSGLQWVQLGVYQGEFAVGSSPGSTHM